MRLRLLPIAALIPLALFAGNCSSPADEPGAEFVGIYNAYAVVTTTPAFGPPQTSTTPTQIFHGTAASTPIVVDDGQCLFPAHLGPMQHQFTLNLPLQCNRVVAIGTMTGHAALVFSSGSGMIDPTSGSLTFVAAGTFTFTPDNPDAGVMAGMGTFSVTVNGLRQ